MKVRLLGPWLASVSVLGFHCSAGPLDDLQQLAGEGNADAQCSLGWMYLEGVGVAKDPSVAANCYRRAANQGNPQAQTNLGLMLAKADGVARDYVEAYKWFALAAGAGLPGTESNQRAVAAQMTDGELERAVQQSREFRSTKPAAPEEDSGFMH